MGRRHASSSTRWRSTRGCGTSPSGKTGDANAWLHSEKEHVIERFSRPSKNYLMYQLAVEDPEVLVKPFTSRAARGRWRRIPMTSGRIHLHRERGA